MKIYVGTQLGNSRGVADELIGRLQEFDTTIKVSTYDLNDLINDDKKNMSPLSAQLLVMETYLRTDQYYGEL